VVAALAVAAAGGVDHLEAGPVAHAVVGGVPAGPADGVLVGVVAVDPDVGKGLGQFDGRPPDAAADVGHPGRAADVREPGVDVGDLGQPFGGQGIDEGGAVEGGLGLDGVGSVVG